MASRDMGLMRKDVCPWRAGAALSLAEFVLEQPLRGCNKLMKFYSPISYFYVFSSQNAKDWITKITTVISITMLLTMKVCIRREAKKFEDKLFFIYGWKGDISQDA